MAIELKGGKLDILDFNVSLSLDRIFATEFSLDNVFDGELGSYIEIDKDHD